MTTVHRPFSYLHAVRSFPREIEVWDRAGKVLHKVASLPLEDKVPINGVPTGPRSVQWRPSEPATLIWVEALDGGDLKNKAPYPRPHPGAEGAIHRRAARDCSKPSSASRESRWRKRAAWRWWKTSSA